MTTSDGLPDFGTYEERFRLDDRADATSATAEDILAALHQMAAIGGRRPADVGSATTEEAAGLECRHDRAAERKGIGLNLGRVLAGGVREWIGTDLNQGDVGRGISPEEGKQGKGCCYD